MKKIVRLMADSIEKKTVFNIDIHDIGSVEIKRYHKDILLSLLLSLFFDYQSLLYFLWNATTTLELCHERPPGLMVKGVCAWRPSFFLLRSFSMTYGKIAQ